MHTLLLAIVLLTVSAFSADNFDHSSYQSTQLSDAAASLEVDPRVNYFFEAAHPRYRTTATFTGRTRPIDLGVKTYIEMWVKTMKHPPAYADLFKTEIEIKQGSETYWMPIQDSLVEPWTQEMLAGSDADLYILLIGAYNHAPVFAISSFEVIRPNNSFKPKPLRGSA